MNQEELNTFIKQGQYDYALPALENKEVKYSNYYKKAHIALTNICLRFNHFSLENYDS